MRISYFEKSPDMSFGSIRQYLSLSLRAADVILGVLFGD